MKLKIAVQVSVDLLMTLALLVLMGYHLWGDVLHEWVGGGDAAALPCAPYFERALVQSLR